MAMEETKGTLPTGWPLELRVPQRSMAPVPLDAYTPARSGEDVSSGQEFQNPPPGLVNQRAQLSVVAIMTWRDVWLKTWPLLSFVLTQTGRILTTHRAPPLIHRYSCITVLPTSLSV